LNLTLAGSQSNFAKNYVNIIPTAVKNIFEKSSNEAPYKTVMKLYRSYYTMISDIHPSPTTAIMKRIVASNSQLMVRFRKRKIDQFVIFPHTLTPAAELFLTGIIKLLLESFRITFGRFTFSVSQPTLAVILYAYPPSLTV